MRLIIVHHSVYLCAPKSYILKQNAKIAKTENYSKSWKTEHCSTPLDAKPLSENVRKKFPRAMGSHVISISP